jgi:hypothetical protein
MIRLKLWRGMNILIFYRAIILVNFELKPKAFEVSSFSITRVGDTGVEDVCKFSF